MPPALEVFQGEERVFASERNWLHPLFDLERVLHSTLLDPATLGIRDKVVGTASAFLITHLGIRSLHAGVLSAGGRIVLDRFGLQYTFDTLTDRIGCATESLLDPAMPLADAVALLRHRAAAG